MITVTIEIEPNDGTERPTTAVINVWSEAHDTKERGNYEYNVHVGDELRAGRILNFRRNHPMAAMRLVAMVLRKEFPFVPEYRPVHQFRRTP